MFGLFKSDPTKKLEKELKITSEKAMQAQRKGDLKLCAELTHQVDELAKKIQEIKESREK